MTFYFNLMRELQLCSDGVWLCSKDLAYGWVIVKIRSSYCSRQRGYMKMHSRWTPTISK